MAEDLTKSVTVKRSSKKKSGYIIGEQDGYYYLAEAPAKARVKPGDRIVGINGIGADEFLDEDDANALIESIRITVVPKDKLEEYDELNDEEDDEEEEYEEYDRDRSRKPKDAGKRNMPIPVPVPVPTGKGKGGGPKVYHCSHCDHDNEDLTEDKDGDLVCEECGNVIQPSGDDAGDGNTVHTCLQCGYENHNLEKDEEGDLVCQECGHVIPEEQGCAQNTIHTCVQCGHENHNLEKDEEGDLVCQECGHVIPEGGKVYTCVQCGHENHDLEKDEEGDLVCQECGHVIPEGGKVHICVQCGHENHNLEKDEEGDLVCQECGHVIPEENGEIQREILYECPDCAHITINPEPDEEGDRICEECGCILPEKYKCTCESCGHENVCPQPDDDGNYLCENCGEELEVEEAEMSGADKLNALRDEAISGPAADGQEFDENGNPITNPEGKKLTPAEMFNPGDVITVTVGKSDRRQDSGLKVDERNGKYYVRKVPTGGLFAKTPVIPGDKILELNGKDHHQYKNVNEVKKVLKDEERITIVVLRKDPDASESSASSIDYDELNPITPDEDGDEDGVDDDTVGYDGDDCGCAWCPDCS